MHWSEELALRIIERNPHKQEYVCAAGISPSGSIHIGNFRDIATSFFVVKALRKQGKRARLLFSWDEFDRMRKVPSNVAAITEGYERYIGAPYVDVPNPFDDGCATFAEHFEAEFMQSVECFDLNMDYRYQGAMYRSGAYVDDILLALEKRGQIFDILDSFRTQDAAEGERDSYYPVSIFCPVCGRDTTRIHSLSGDNRIAEYSCACGHSGSFDFLRDHNCKLVWKVDWPMRWRYEQVDFEPGGKDHASPSGSYQVGKRISEEIFGFPAPVFQGYEFIGIKGATGKMSGSTGLNLTAASLLKLYQPELILWLYARTEPTRAFDFCFDDGILRQYSEFDRQLEALRAGQADEHTQAIMYNCLIENRHVETVPMNHLVQLGSVVDFNVPMLETVFEKIGTPYKHAQFADRLDRARYWLEQCAPENVNRLRSGRNWEVYDQLNAEQRREIELLHQTLSANNYTLEELNNALYAIPKQTAGADTGDDKAIKERQKNFFATVYKLLIDKERGPRLYLFLYAINKDDYLHLLDFSYPITEAEAAPPPPEEAEQPPAERVYGEPDATPPFAPEINIEQFEQVDLRVCRVVKCSELRKSHSCLKLTLNDGIGERVIVSSIKGEYTPEQLIGRKIIVVANLKPARLAGVTSEGMLLAGTNNACGCKVIFVDDAIPEGTPVR
ncbi:MAG: lysine--tRNA ligase [Bacillota bacterium]|nr:lysine--tRNA ligase [Bacillota bacterium]